MPSTILLSASVPAGSGGSLAAGGPADLREAVTEVTREIVSRGGRLTCGGHPSIAGALLDVCADLRCPEAVTVYQSERFRHEIPAATWSLTRAGWGILRFTSGFGDRELDLELMRIAMVTENPIAGAVFIGGNAGVATEHKLLQGLTYRVPRVSLTGPGGASARLDGSERTLVDRTSRAYPSVARQISRAFGFR